MAENNITFELLLVNGFKKAGNWYYMDTISINLMTNTIKYKSLITLPFNWRVKTIKDIFNFKEVIEYTIS